MTKLEQMWHDTKRAQYGLDHLELDKETGGKPSYSIDEKPTTLIQKDIERREYLRQKYNIKGDSLLCEGLLGMRLQAREESLAERILRDDATRSKDMRLSLARIEYQGKKVLLALEVTKF